MYLGDVFYQSLPAGVMVGELGKSFFFENAHTIWNESSGGEDKTTFGDIYGAESSGKRVEFF